MQSKEVICYVDGACSGNPGLGGWGVLCLGINQNLAVFLSDSEVDTTNNKMEILAAIKLLEYLGRKEREVIIYTDSIYLKNGITNWIKSWQKNGWLSSAKKPVKNVELWKRLVSLSESHCISWRWVRGHSGNIGNEIADQLAVNAIKNKKKQC